MNAGFRSMFGAWMGGFASVQRTRFPTVRYAWRTASGVYAFSSRQP